MPQPSAPAPASAPTDGQLDAVRRLLAQRYGFRVRDDGWGAFRDRVARRLARAGAPDFATYWRQLQLQPAGDLRGELQELLEELLIHESEFRRNPEQFAALEQEILPAWADDLPAQTRTIASLGCATGPEAYSLAIAAERVLGPAAARVQIAGLDLSRRALATARQATYPESRLRGIPQAERSRWFVRQADQWQPHARLRRRVRFLHHNLLDPLPLSGLDVVFCCNVLIYFPREMMPVVLEHIHAALRPGGHLFLGHTDSVQGLSLPFRPVVRPDTTYYLRHAAVQPRPHDSIPSLSHEHASRQP